MKGIIAGVIAGFAGALVWAAIVVFAGFEIGWLAWGIGAAVGGAVAWGSEGTPAMGVAAVVISVLAIAGGKYFSVEMFLANGMDDANQQIAQQLETDEYPANTVARQMQKGYQLNERLLRPAMVMVAKEATFPKPEDDESTTATDENN